MLAPVLFGVRLNPCNLFLNSKYTSVCVSGSFKRLQWYLYCLNSIVWLTECEEIVIFGKLEMNKSRSLGRMFLLKSWRGSCWHNLSRSLQFSITSFPYVWFINTQQFFDFLLPFVFVQVYLFLNYPQLLNNKWTNIFCVFRYF